jgi:CubicO group peptidase (beta-lactamase class C family)
MTRRGTILASLVAALSIATPLAQGAGQVPSSKAPAPSFADINRPERLSRAFPEIDRIMREFVERAHVPGAAWGIVLDGRLAHSGTAGYRDLASKAPVETDTVFRIASMTKSFTAMAILKLRDEGRLSLEDPAEKYVPELHGLVYPTSDSPRITIRHLLSHAEGFPEDNPWGDRQLADTDEQLSRTMRGGIPFSHAPGVAYEYSNYGFAILGRIVSNVSGVPYADYVQRTILTPLGMASTTLEPSSVAPGKLALGYRWEDEQWKPEPILKHGAFGSMGGMLTTIPDLARYVAAYLEAWPPHDGPETSPIRRASLREMQHVWQPSPASVSHAASGDTQLTTGGYGFALRISQTCEFPLVVAHSGGLPGYGSQMRWLPDYGVGIIAFGNLRYTGWGAPIDAAVAALSATGALQPRVVHAAPALQQARDAIARLVIRWDDRSADGIAAENLFLDSDKAHRRADLDRLHQQMGECTAGDGFDDVDNPLRGQWTMPCERGRLRVAITLAPTAPPKVQSWTVSVAPAPAPAKGTCRE